MRGLAYACTRNARWLACKLPSGRLLWYFKPRIEHHPDFGKELVAEGVNGRTRQWDTNVRLWRGLLTENCVQAVAREQSGDRIGLISADFDCGKPLRVEQPRQLRRERPIGVETFAPCEQGLVRLEFLHSGTELGAFGDIGRIAQDQVEFLGQARRPIPLHELGPRLEAEATGIGRSVGQRLP